MMTEILTLAAHAALPATETGGAMALAGLVPLLPLIGFGLCGLFAMLKVKSKLPAFASVGLLAASFFIVLAMYMGGGASEHATIVNGFDWITFRWGSAAGQQFTANVSFYIDGLTLLWMLFVTGLGTLIALYASEYMAHDVGPGYCRFFAAFNLFVFSMACLVMGDNLLLLYLGWEGVGLCSYLLIGYFYQKPSAVAAAKKAFIMNRIGDLGLALGIMLTFVHFGSVEYRVIFEKAQVYIGYLQNQRINDIPLHVQIIPILLMIGAFGKSAQLPLYVWLPDAMEGPTPVSALIHAATMVTAGVFLIARTYPLFLCSEYALPIVAWTGGLTALLAATIGMAQFDIKRIMAYSTVSQLGYMFAGLGVLSSNGAANHVFTHAFFKAMLFLSCGAVMHGFAGQLDLRKLSGVAWMKGWGVVGFAMLVGCLNLSGFPFTAGFFSKDMIIAEAFTTQGYAYNMLGWVLLLTAGLTAYYTFRVFFRVFVGPKYFEPGDELHADHADDHGHDAHAPVADAAHADAHAKDAAHDFHPHPPGLAINFVLGTLAIASVLIIFLPAPSGGHAGWVGGMVANSSAAFETPFTHEEHAAPAAEHAPAAGHQAGHAKPFMPMFQLDLENQAGGPGQLHAGDFLGFNPHSQVMYWASGGIGALGIFIAYLLHYKGRTTAATAAADALLPKFGSLARGDYYNWFVDVF